MSRKKFILGSFSSNSSKKRFQKGQFFSPDLIIAALVFSGALFIFFNASTTIFTQVSLMESRKELEENSHVALRGILSTPGEPFDWESRPLSDINSFGLSVEKGVLDQNKVATFADFLDTNYNYVKSISGFGRYDFKMEILDSQGLTVIERGTISSQVRLKFIYERMVLYNNQPSIFRGVLSYGD